MQKKRHILTLCAEGRFEFGGILITLIEGISGRSRKFDLHTAVFGHRHVSGLFQIPHNRRRSIVDRRVRPPLTKRRHRDTDKHPKDGQNNHHLKQCESFMRTRIRRLPEGRENP